MPDLPNLTPIAMHPLSKSPVVSGNTAFGIALLQKLAPESETGTNLFLSPYSVSQAVLLAANGTTGATRTAYLDSLQVGSAPLKSVNDDSRLLTGLLRPPSDTENGKASPAYEWTVANAIWSRYEPKQGYVDACADFYAADAKPITTADAINDWAGKKTRGRITQIATREHVEYSDLILTNAVYFKGHWISPFAAESTFDEPFYLTQGAAGTREQPFMHREDRQMRWYAGSDYEAVSLPYRGGMSMIVLLPQSGVTANALVGSVSSAEWQTMMRGFRPTWIALSLPKFEIRYAEELLGSLKSLGMPVQGDFSTVSDRLKKTAINAVVHKTFLRVDEKGSEAAAVTMMAAAGGPGPPEPVEKPRPFVVNRPFLCAIVHDTTGTVLFLGVINDPKAIP